MTAKEQNSLAADPEAFPQRAYRATCRCRHTGEFHAWQEGVLAPVFALNFVSALKLAGGCFDAFADLFGWEIDPGSVRVAEITAAPEPQLGDELADAKAKIGVLITQRTAKNLEVETLRAELNELKQVRDEGTKPEPLVRIGQGDGERRIYP
jgi:hypothetical protein